MPRQALTLRIPTAVAALGLMVLVAGLVSLRLSVPAQGQQQGEQVAAVQVVRSWMEPAMAGDAKVKTVIGNDEPVPITLIGARTDAAAGVMMVHRGQPASAVVIAPRDTLGPYGFYLLLDDVAKPLRHGDTVQLELTFADRAPLRLEVPVGGAMPEG